MKRILIAIAILLAACSPPAPSPSSATRLVAAAAVTGPGAQLDAQIADLQARVAALEAKPQPAASPSVSAPPSLVPTPSPTVVPTPTPTTPPPPTPTPLPTATPSQTPSGPIVITSSGTVIDGARINAGAGSMAINVKGTAANPLANVTIRNCTIAGGLFGIYATHVNNLVVENCTISDVDYAGIAGYSWVGGRISGNIISRVGVTKDPVSGFQGNNAYGITLDRSHTGNLTTDPRSSDVSIDHNNVRDVPLWMCINTHAGVRVTVADNTTAGCPRAMFFAGDGDGNNSEGIVVTRNLVLAPPVTRPGGTTDIESILFSQWKGGSITLNKIGAGYPMPFDYQGASTGVTVSGNVRV